MDRVVNSSEFQISVPITHADGSKDTISLQPRSSAFLAPGSTVDPTFVLLTDEITHIPTQVLSDGVQVSDQVGD